MMTSFLQCGRLWQMFNSEYTNVAQIACAQITNHLTEVREQWSSPAGSSLVRVQLEL